MDAAVSNKITNAAIKDLPIKEYFSFGYPQIHGCFHYDHDKTDYSQDTQNRHKIIT